MRKTRIPWIWWWLFRYNNKSMIHKRQNKLDLKKKFSAKDNVKKMRKQATVCEEIFAKNTSIRCIMTVIQNTQGTLGAYLVVHWLRIQFPMQKTQVWSLVRELRSHMPQGNKDTVQPRKQNRIYKSLLKLNIKKTNNSIKNRAKNLMDIFPKIIDSK